MRLNIPAVPSVPDVPLYPRTGKKRVCAAGICLERCSGTPGTPGTRIHFSDHGEGEYPHNILPITSCARIGGYLR